MNILGESRMEVIYKNKRYSTKINKKGQVALKLYFSGVSDISDIDGLSSLRDLEVLDLRGNKITEIKGLENLKNLQELHLSMNKITSIDGISKLNNLQKLNLVKNQITEISGLENLTNLEELKLSANIVTEIRGFKDLTNLKKLELSYNQINEIKGLENLTQLEALDLSGNQINEVKEINNLINLREIKLSNNKIAAIRGFDTLVNLEELNLYDNPVWRRAKKQFGEAKNRLGLIRDPQAIVKFCQKGGDTLEEEQKLIAGYETRLKRNFFLTFLGIFIMSIGPLLIFEFDPSTLGWITMIGGAIMTLYFKNNTNWKIKHRLSFGALGLILIIVGTIILVRGDIRGFMILMIGILWVVLCTGLLGLALKYDRSGWARGGAAGFK